MKKSLLLKIKNIPPKPGVYIFHNKSGNVLYVGKAKNLKKRVTTYFQKKKQIAPDKLIMLSQISDIDYIITDTEAEALLLESNLIKKHQPRFNIILKDDKNYLYIKINLKEKWPIVSTVRHPNFKDHNFYAGPYPSADPARHTLKLLARTFKFCTCKNFTRKPCLRFKLGWCVCPAETKISNEDYRKIFTQVIKFLKGQTSEVLQELKSEMKNASTEKKYEHAARFRDSIRAIEKTISHQKVISTKNENYDVISLARTSPPDLGGTRGGVNLFQIREGKLINKQNFILEHTKNSTDKKIIESFINQHYSTAQDVPKEIIVPTKIKNPCLEQRRRVMPHLPAGEAGASCLMPRRGKKKQLLSLGEENARNYLRQQCSNVTMKQSNHETINELKKIFNLKKSPTRIEAYDVSNIQGIHATGSMVVFTNGQPDKSEYRRFKIKTVKGANDVAMLTEIISRRLKNKSLLLPNLILLDGGKPQLNAVVTLMPHASCLMPIALAKREEQIFIPNKKEPIILPPTSPTLQLLQRIRDEAHRFARNYYLKRHKKSQTHSALDDIQGLGPKTKKKLLQKFGSIQEIKKATFKNLSKVASSKLAERIKEQL